MSLSGFPAFFAGMTVIITVLSIYGIYLKRKSDKLTELIDAYDASEEAKKNGDAPA